MKAKRKPCKECSKRFTPSPRRMPNNWGLYFCGRPCALKWMLESKTRIKFNAS